MHVMEPPVENIPVLTIQDPLATSGAVVLDCRPLLLPASMDISGVDLSAGRFPAVSAGMDVLPHEREPSSSGGDLIGLICPELGVAPLVDPGTDLEDERPTPVGLLSPGVCDFGHGPRAGVCSPRSWCLAGDGDAHSGSRGGVFHDPCGVPCTPDSGVVVGCFGSPGGGFSC